MVLMKKMPNRINHPPESMFVCRVRYKAIMSRAAHDMSQHDFSTILRNTQAPNETNRSLYVYSTFVDEFRQAPLWL